MELSQVVADRAGAADDSMTQIEILMLEARRAEKDFQLRRETRYVERHAKAMQQAGQRFEALAANLDLADHRTLAADSRKLADAYATQFADLVATETRSGLTENDGLLGALRKSVHAIETTLKANEMPALQVLMLMMRRHEKDFLARADAKYGEDLKKRAGEFEAALKGAGLPDAARAQIAADMASYQKDFFALMDGVLAAKAANGKLSQAYADFEPKLEQLSKAVNAVEVAAAEDIAATRATAAQLISVTIGVVTFVVGTLSFLIAAGIFGPVRRMTEAMLQLANRDWTTEVPARDRGDEIGQMAQAVQVFKDNGIEGERLQAEAQAAEARQREMELEAQRERERLAAEAAAETTRKLRELEAAMKQAEADRLAEQEKLRAEAEATRKKEMSALADGFEATVMAVVNTVSSSATEMQSSSTALSATAEETSRQSTAVAAASEQASANVQTVASASEELSASISEISRQVSESTRTAAEAVAQAQSTGKTVDGLAE
ncbi:HAMP domain-containing protein, partial [Desertibaculum subflavum]|uniref:HAMP domain-containing protein n=1 Tax=Desertibaculum subflavum TaxID=2268458 RepID=UPI000E663E9E